MDYNLSTEAILGDIGQSVRAWRLEANLSQKALAQKAGISLPTLQQIEYGKGTSLTHLISILRVLGHLDSLSGLTEPTDASPSYQRASKGGSENDFRRIHLAVAAIESASRKMKSDGATTYRRLNKYGLVDSYLIGCYDQLHSQSNAYLCDSTIEALKNWEENE